MPHMNISFRQLSQNDFPLLLKWLETPHVKAWWDRDVSWTLEQITQKYQSYIEQFKIDHGKKKWISASIITFNKQPIGYIQYYDARDFLVLPDPLSSLHRLAAIDFYIGEETALRHGIGSIALSQFIQERVFKQFEAALVTPDIQNNAAIACYQKAGFTPCLAREEAHELWLVARKKCHQRE